ncbi:hypothetical protein [Aliiroseovarius lamellibrachiae]|uniref:hypothetical protein n=1 Tax=Aliiroseovarius lamellibrachiae TaxID=1924933 RepID=UPI001BE100F1|nr:hypothetical protein [Aliiroseovarius lamellibrachiae]MBT2129651.1 hypothetical protein [Aliiroseovarius lamellibrachiae]
MEIPNNIRILLEETIRQKLSEEIVQDIKIESIEVDELASELRIIINVSTAVDPAKMARGYFGLTNLVRKSLAKEDSGLGSLFPIISPTFGHEVHA